MKKLFSTLMLTGVLALGGNTHAADKTTTSSTSLTVMSYNLRFLNPNEKAEDQWSRRKLLMAELLRQLAPDVMGTQEGVYQQLKDLTTLYIVNPEVLDTVRNC